MADKTLGERLEDLGVSDGEIARILQEAAVKKTNTRPSGLCRICGRVDDRIMAFKGTGICCETCRKISVGDIDHERALDYLWSINTNTALINHAAKILDRSKQNGN